MASRGFRKRKNRPRTRPRRKKQQIADGLSHLDDPSTYPTTESEKAYREFLDRFAPTNEGLSESEIECVERARKTLKTAGIVAQLVEPMIEMLEKFAPSNNGLSEPEIACAERARKSIQNVRVIHEPY